MPNNKLVDREVLKAFREKLDQHFINNGEYDPTAAVGNADAADNLTPYSENSGIAQHEPFVFQSTAGGSDVGALCQLKSLRGQSYVLNQLVKDGNFAATTNWSINSNTTLTVQDNVGTMTVASGTYNGIYQYISIITGHKYLVKASVKPSTATANKWRLICAFFDNSVKNTDIDGSTSWQDIAIISTAIETANKYIKIEDVNGDGSSIDIKNIQIVDLTQMFGAGNEPTTIEEFNRLFPLPYYEYNTGELVSSQASKLITVGYNQFDGELEQGGISGSDGSLFGSTTDVRSKNYTRVIPGQTYSVQNGTETLTNNYVRYYDGQYNFIKGENAGNSSQGSESEITIPENAQYLKLCFYQGGNDITPSDIKEVRVHLTWDSSKTGYEPYDKHEYGLPNIELKSAGSVYDEIKSNGTKITRVGYINLGDLSWSYQQAYGVYEFYTSGIASYVKAGTSNLLCAIYTKGSRDALNNMEMSFESNGTTLFIRNDSYTDAATFKSAMNGVYLFYELATPTESESIAFQENIAIDDWGTMEFVSTYPQGNDFFYYVDYKAFIDSLGNREDIGFDASEIVSQEELTEALADVDLSDYAEKSMVGFPVISAPASTTLTADEKAMIIKGVRINGTFLTYDNIVFFPALEYGGYYYGTYYVGGRPSRMGTYAINGGNLISITSDKNLRLEGIIQINGKAIPDYPSSPSIAQQLIYDTDNTLKYTNIAGFPVITAPSSTTLTADEVTRISKGAVFLGDSNNKFLTYEKIVFFPLGDTSFGENGGFALCVNGFNPELRCYTINSSNVISIRDATTKRIRLQSITQINGKNIPDYPSNTGTFVLKCVDGTLTWVQE